MNNDPIPSKRKKIQKSEWRCNVQACKDKGQVFTTREAFIEHKQTVKHFEGMDEYTFIFFKVLNINFGSGKIKL